MPAVSFTFIFLGVHASASSAIVTPSVSATPIVPIVPSVLPSLFMPVAPSVSAESRLPNAPSVTTSAVPLEASVAHESNLTDATVPTEDTNDDADGAPFASTDEVELTELGTSVYNSEYQSLGMVIHLQSGSVICVRCRCAVQLGNVVGHFGRNHSLNRWIAQYNVHQQQRYGEQLDVELSQIHPEPLTIHNLEEKLRDQALRPN
ncbi:uncharacterized protein ATC70_004073 [Mucor velutinosus]|uniref:Uncharacterized protein n=1 Tax=Mucor velutinosus TaxID=708070 RepID=A0AAN7DQR5_9FUNG|nr:hypothetical protein ATC70_004073 [Mucor velutinosus]